LRRVNDFSFFIFVDFYEVNLFQDETHSFVTHEIWSFYHMIEKQYGSSFHKSYLFFWQK